MNIKSSFLNGFLKEEAYVEQPKGFIDPTMPYHVSQKKYALCMIKKYDMDQTKHMKTPMWL